jgi:riboflavin synthase
MFTGIVEEIGHVLAIDVHDGHARLHVGCEEVVVDAALGDSISVSGCCLTVTSLPPASDGGGFTSDLMAETLRATALGDLEVGAAANLERAMRADTRFGGHLVQGHVDGVGTVVDRDERPGTVFLTIEAPDEVARYLVPKGSVTVDGVSLTVVDLPEPGRFRVGLIPHTLEVTTFGDRHPGDRVNLEADVIAKYVERLLVGGTVSPYVPGPDVSGAGAAASGPSGTTTDQATPSRSAE